MTGGTVFINNSRRTKQLIVIAMLAAAVITIGAIIMPASTTSAKSYCGYDEHQHDESCYTTELICGLEEAEGHQHDDTCYNEEQELICGLEESEGHQHDDTCYSEKKLTCGMEEHVHSLQCYSNPDADIETSSDWEASFKDVDLEDEDKSDREKAIEIAQTQLGYAESVNNYKVMKDGETKKGITRYGQWYGDSYGDWCAMFCSFCIRYAGIEKDDYPISANCDEWVEALKAVEKEKLYHKASSSYKPESGDLIFYDFDGDKKAEHIGFVYSVEDKSGDYAVAPFDEESPDMCEGVSWKDDKDKLIITAIEGNHNGQVEYVERDADEEYILGFGELPDDQDKGKIKKVYEGSDYKVTATYTKKAKLPADTWLKVKEIKEGSEAYEKYYNKALKEYDEEASIKFARFFDISFVSDGKEIEPEAAVDIKITYDDAIAMDEDASAGTVHYSGKNVETIKTRTLSAGKDKIDAFKFSSDSFSVFGTIVMATGDNSDYEKVSTIDSTSAKYIILNKAGTYAFNGSGGATSVTMTEITGKTGHYTLTGVTSSDKWTFSATGTSVNGTIKNVENSKYLRLGNSGIVSSSSTNLTTAYSSNAWTITRDSQYRLTFSGGSFSRSTANDDTTKLIILKEISAGDSEDDEDDEDEIDISVIDSSVKPTYPAYIDPSGTVTGSGSLEGNSDINVSWASDAATSKIEADFTGTDTDGQVLTDKSVVYGKDDYGAFESYDKYNFGVTLSALAQEYQLPESDQKKIPLDVVFILDVSGSMKTEVNGTARFKILENAVNTAMTEIMDANTQNRAGIVLFSSESGKILDLDHYEGKDGKFVEYDSTNNKISTVKGITGTKVGTLSSSNDGSFKQSGGTFTQLGIAQGAKILKDNTDTTTKIKVGSGDNYKEETVIRQPVIILLSDGDPTHCTDKYSDVLNTSNSPRGYGSGSASTSSNNKGILGYYTVLSANYYKRQVSNNYNKNALMYSIGLGISPDSNTSTDSWAGDHYKRAVLNPSAANITALEDTNGKNYETTALMLKKLLSNTYTESTVTVSKGDGSNQTTYWSSLGTLGNTVPVRKNPYTDYAYADDAYFDSYDTAGLQNVFKTIIKAATKVKSYSFILQKRSSCEIEDTIGDGMELKSDPKLYYGGNIYTHTSSDTSDTGSTDFNKVTQYHYSGTYKATDGSGKTADLSKIVVKVFKNTTTGAQKVVMSVPIDEMPVYTRGGGGDYEWYYEELPVRLIYQVGLTAKSVSSIEDMGAGDTLTFNTNKWKDGVTAGSLVYPTDDNTYYQDTGAYEDYSTNKASNPSSTAVTAVTAAKTRSNVTLSGSSVNTLKLSTALGNNGTLSFTADATELTVTKVWDGIPSADMPAKIQVQLYRKSANEAEAAVGDPVDIAPDSDNKWKYTFESLPSNDSEGDPYKYRVEEVSYGPYAATYSTNEAAYDSTLGTITPITITNTTSVYSLPGTGGEGALPLTCAGFTVLLLVAALGYRRYARTR